MRYNLSYIDGVPLEGEGFAHCSLPKRLGEVGEVGESELPGAGNVLKHLGIPSNVQVIFYVFFFSIFGAWKIQ